MRKSDITAMFMKSPNPFIIVAFGLITIACRRGPGQGSAGCSGTMTLVDDSNAIVSTPPVVPAGGFVNIGGRSCTATFLLKSGTASSLVVTAYTAQHCFRENGSSGESVSISLHLPATNKTKAGYLKNITAHDEFYTRRQQFLAEIQKLGVTAAADMAKRATDITLYADRGLERLAPNNSAGQEVNESDDYKRNVCLSSQTDRLSISGSQQICWSAFDTTVRTFEVKASEINPDVYRSIRTLLEDKKNTHEALLNSSKQIAKQFNLWNDRIHSQTGGWRFLNYIEIVSFLNKEVCGKYLPKDDPNYSICSVRDPFVSAVKKYLTEVDTDGKKKSIADKAQELGFGLDSPYLRSQGGSGASNMMLRDLLMMKLSDGYLNFMNKGISELRGMFPLKDEKIHALPKQFSIAANPVLRGNSNEMAFGLVDSAALVPPNSPVPSKGVQPLGILRMYLSEKDARVSFGATDSGALLTIGGVVPLLVLNTVNDKPTSGGTAVLALPEPGPEEDSPVISARASPSKQSSQNVSQASSETAVDSDSAMIKHQSIVCR